MLRLPELAAVNQFGAVTGDHDDESVIDDYRYVLSIAYTEHDETIQIAEARQIFAELAAAARWPVLLVRGLDVLLGAWNPAAGLTWFSPEASIDAADRDRWHPYALPRVNLPSDDSTKR